MGEGSGGGAGGGGGGRWVRITETRRRGRPRPGFNAHVTRGQEQCALYASPVMCDSVGVPFLLVSPLFEKEHEATSVHSTASLPLRDLQIMVFVPGLVALAGICVVAIGAVLQFRGAGTSDQAPIYPPRFKLSPGDVLRVGECVSSASGTRACLEKGGRLAITRPGSDDVEVVYAGTKKAKDTRYAMEVRGGGLEINRVTKKGAHESSAWKSNEGNGGCEFCYAIVNDDGLALYDAGYVWDSEVWTSSPSPGAALGGGGGSPGAFSSLILQLGFRFRRPSSFAENLSLV